MGLPPFSESKAPLIIDTSAAINLSASGCAADIVRALPNRLLAVDAIPAELAEGRRRGRSDADFFNELVSASLIQVVELENPAITVFERLVIGGAADTLDDGEAATIAYAAESDAFAIIDERKAIRICSERFPKLRIACSIDLFMHPDVLRILGRGKLAQAVLNSLHLARMRVPIDRSAWVVDLLGPDEASQCLSLPRGVRVQK